MRTLFIVLTFVAAVGFILTGCSDDGVLPPYENPGIGSTDEVHGRLEEPTWEFDLSVLYEFPHASGHFQSYPMPFSGTATIYTASDYYYEGDDIVFVDLEEVSSGYWEQGRSGLYICAAIIDAGQYVVWHAVRGREGGGWFKETDWYFLYVEDNTMGHATLYAEFYSNVM